MHLLLCQCQTKLKALEHKWGRQKRWLNRHWGQTGRTFLEILIPGRYSLCPNLPKPLALRAIMQRESTSGHLISQRLQSGPRRHHEPWAPAHSHTPANRSKYKTSLKKCNRDWLQLWWPSFHWVQKRSCKLSVTNANLLITAWYARKDQKVWKKRIWAEQEGLDPFTHIRPRGSQGRLELSPEPCYS